MKLTIKQLRLMIGEAIGRGQTQAIADVVYNTNKVMSSGIMDLSKVFAGALRDAKDPEVRQSLQVMLGLVQDAVHSLDQVGDQLVKVRQRLRKA